jgi:hypothetical protein
MAMRGSDALGIFLNALGIGREQGVRLPASKIVIVAEMTGPLKAYICTYPDRDVAEKIARALEGAGAEPHFVKDVAVDKKGNVMATADLASSQLKESDSPSGPWQAVVGRQTKRYVRALGRTASGE